MYIERSVPLRSKAVILRFLRKYWQRRLSESVDSGKPLSFFLSFVVRWDRESRCYYDDLLRLEKNLADDLAGFLSEIPLSETKTSLPQKIDQPADAWPYREKVSSHSFVARRVGLSVCVLLIFGLGLLPFWQPGGLHEPTVPGPQAVVTEQPMQSFSSENNPFGQIIAPLQTTVSSQKEVFQTTLLTSTKLPPIPESLRIVKLDWAEKDIRFDPEAFHLLAAQSQEIASRLPLVQDIKFGNWFDPKHAEEQ